MDIINTVYLYLIMSILCIFIGFMLKSHIILKFAKLFTKTILKEQEYIHIYKFICICSGVYFGIVSYILFKTNDYRMILISMPLLFIFIGLQLWNNKKHLVR
ncbi:hypothetical protein [Clostridium arbusti]|uniref:hypothetical protein n=1 Tax=Clostridium arbusti TaxID=1137848 RepID=UPI0002895417|nr:hypothetical protein [Clostridium arbusti]